MMGAVLFMYRVRCLTHISNIPVSYCWLVSALAASDLSRYLEIESIYLKWAVYP